MLTWCRSNPGDAALLMRHGLRDLLRGDASPALTDHARANQHTVRAALLAVADATGHPPHDVVLALVDLPYAVARRTTRDGGTPSEDDIAAVRRAVSLLLADGG